MASVKSIIKSGIERHVDAVYRLSLENDTVSYDKWIKARELSLPKFDMSVSFNGSAQDIDVHKISYTAKYEGVSVRIIPYSSVLENFSVKNFIEDILIFVNGELTECAVPLIVEEFMRRQQVNVVYGDEDIIADDNQERTNPYFKPYWSPNAFLDHFYFCNIVAVRRGAFRLFEWSQGYFGAASIYHTLLRYLFNDEKTLKNSVGRVSEVLVHASDYDNNDLQDEMAERLAARMKVKCSDTISVIIPSKDNPNLLRTSITSIIANTPDNIKTDIIVVDNGSSEENLLAIKKLQEELGFIHMYNPMEFNFAYMCNLGAECASSDVLLFYNDDVTVADRETLEIMYREATYSFTGAVGVKLLYPDTVKIQHAGVINTRIGPAHKLQFMEDDRTYYHGFNRKINNVLAVTGAAIMIRRDIYNEVGGMNEALKVAFNDIDLCFKLCEHGYSNVCCNNTYMYHAESITRGRDTTREAIVRLWKERDRLYQEHPDFKSYDPYYSKNLINDCLDTRFTYAGEYEFDVSCERTDIFEEIITESYRDENCIQNGIEYAGKINNYLFGAEHENVLEDDYYIQGFSYLLGSDNALYKRKLLLLNEETGTCFATGFNGAIRNDVSINCPNEKNVEKSGFSLAIPKDLLPKGSYRVGIAYEKMYSRELLLRYTNNYLTVDNDEPDERL